MKDEVDKNKNFTYEQTIDDYEKRTTDKNVTQCSICPAETGTCHYDCSYSDGPDKINCSAMDWETGNCTICPKRCKWDLHINSRIHYVLVKKILTKTLHEVKAKHDNAQNQMKNSTILILDLLKDA